LIVDFNEILLNQQTNRVEPQILYSLNPHKDHSEIILLLQERILASATSWYSTIGSTEISVNYLSEKHFRWSTHQIYAIEDKKKRSIFKILVKIIPERGINNRNQDISVRPSESLAFEYNALLRIYHQFHKVSIDGITAVRPLAYYPDINALALEYIPGKHFLEILLEAGSIFGNQHKRQIAEDTAFKGGKLLSNIHNIPQGSYPQRQVFNCDLYFANLHEKISSLFNLIDTKIVREMIFDTRKLIEHFLKSFNETVTISHNHADYYPENIVRLPDGRIFTIDTTLHLAKPVEQDIAKFIIGINFTKRRILFGRFGMSNIVPKFIILAFLKGYQSSGKYNSHILLAYQFLALLQRWIEVLEIIKTRFHSFLDCSFIKERITVIMEKELGVLQEEIKNQQI